MASTDSTANVVITGVATVGGKQYLVQVPITLPDARKDK